LLLVKEELAHGANAGLDKAVAFLEPIKSKYPEVLQFSLFFKPPALSIRLFVEVQLVFHNLIPI
jgi:hypothetical protein